MVGFSLFVAFTVIPAFETWLLIEIGQVVGGWQTVGWLVAMGLAGAALGKRAGSGVLRQIGEDLRGGKSPADSVVEGALVLVGSVLLITPGIMSDLTGLLLFLPPVRRFLAPRIKAAALRWLASRPGGFSGSVGTMGPGPAHRAEEEAAERVRKGFDHPSF